VHERRRLLTVNVDVGENHFVDAVIIPRVVRRHLERPFRHTRIGVTRENRHRPLIVAGTLRRIPRAGIARAVIEQIEFGIVGIPSPRRAAADFPLVGLPGLRTGIFRTGELGADANIAIGARAVRAPRFFAGIEAIGGQVTANAIFAAGDADDDFVLHHERCCGKRLAGFRI